MSDKPCARGKEGGREGGERGEGRGEKNIPDMFQVHQSVCYTSISCPILVLGASARVWFQLAAVQSGIPHRTIVRLVVNDRTQTALQSNL